MRALRFFLAAGAADTVALLSRRHGWRLAIHGLIRSVAGHLRLSANGREVLVADSAAGTVYAIRDLRGAGRIEAIASRRDGLGKTHRRRVRFGGTHLSWRIRRAK